MAYLQTSSYTFGYQPPPSPSTPPRRSWWSRPIVTSNDAWGNAAKLAPCCGGFLTVIAVFLYFLFIDKSHSSHANFSIQSISVSTSAYAMWHVDFFVQNPSSRYSIYYEIDDVSVRLGPLNAAVLNISHKRDSRDLTAFSLAFLAAGGNKSDRLDVELRGKHRQYLDHDKAGHFDISCQGLTRSSEKIMCQTSFRHMVKISPKVRNSN